MSAYLDNAATTYPSAAAIKRANELMTRFPGNPSSLHQPGLDAASALRDARGQVAAALGCTTGEVVFTSGGTEADNLAILGAANAHKRRGTHIISTTVEHPAVLRSLSALEDAGFEVTYISPGPTGAVSAADVLAALRPDTILVSVMAVNNESGAIMPVSDIGRALKAKSPGTLFHCDGVQSFLKMRLSLSGAGIDLYSVSAHKIHGVKGTGALFVRKGVRLIPLLCGGGQERGLRSGTEALPAIAAFGAAAAEGAENFEQRSAAVRALRDYAEQTLPAVRGLQFLPVSGLPHVFTVLLPGYKSEVVLRYLSELGVYVSAGSACAKGKKSAVLTAMGLPRAQIDSALRISLCHENTAADIDLLREGLSSAVKTLAKI